MGFFSRTTTLGVPNATAAIILFCKEEGRKDNYEKNAAFINFINIKCPEHKTI